MSFLPFITSPALVGRNPIANFTIRIILKENKIVLSKFRIQVCSNLTLNRFILHQICFISSSDHRVKGSRQICQGKFAHLKLFKYILNFENEFYWGITPALIIFLGVKLHSV